MSNNKNAASTTELLGMKEICSYMRRSETTILKLIKEEDFPAKKICGAWVSDTEIIGHWRKQKLQEIG
jgi:predicted DNA-binding transcriptional regulator AlpA